MAKSKKPIGFSGFCFLNPKPTEEEDVCWKKWRGLGKVAGAGWDSLGLGQESGGHPEEQQNYLVLFWDGTLKHKDLRKR